MATFVVMVSPEDAEPPQVFGTFRSADTADRALAKWRQSPAAGGRTAVVLPVQAAADLAPPKQRRPAGGAAEAGPEIVRVPVKFRGRPLRQNPGPGPKQRGMHPPAGPLTFRPPSGPAGSPY